MSVLDEVAAERERHREIYGASEDWPDGTSEGYRTLRDWSEKVTEELADHGELTWTRVLLMDTYAALFHTDPARLRPALVRVAAVALAWIEALDRRAAGSEASDG